MQYPGADAFEGAVADDVELERLVADELWHNRGREHLAYACLVHDPRRCVDGKAPEVVADGVALTDVYACSNGKAQLFGFRRHS